MLIEDPMVIDFQWKFVPPTLIQHPMAIRDTRVHSLPFRAGKKYIFCLYEQDLIGEQAGNFIKFSKMSRL